MPPGKNVIYLPDVACRVWVLGFAGVGYGIMETVLGD